MKEQLDRSVVGMGLALILTLAALVLPWWTASSALGLGGGTVALSQSAGPFYAGGGLIETWEATVAGVLVAAALAGFLVGFLVLWGTLELHPAWEARVPGIVYGSGVLLAVAIVFAVAAWPGQGHFWDGTQAGAFSQSLSAGVGWYAALVATILGPVSMYDVVDRGQISGVEGDPRGGSDRAGV